MCEGTAGEGRLWEKHVWGVNQFSSGSMKPRVSYTSTASGRTGLTKGQKQEHTQGRPSMQGCGCG